MSRVFVDTSAVIALLVATDEFHQAAKSFAKMMKRVARRLP
jgi:predicted nucleic acid-binding protein